MSDNGAAEGSPRPRRCRPMGVDPMPQPAAFQDDICALRLALWTLERSVVPGGADPVPLIDLIIRRAERLREAVIRSAVPG